MIFTNSSIASLVVPAISVTIALFSPNIEFNRDDFPTFGLPIITVFSPSLNIFPLSDVSYSFFISRLISSAFPLRVLYVISPLQNL